MGRQTPHGRVGSFGPGHINRRRSTYRSFQTESDGSYDLTNLRPGNYNIFAVFDTELEYANPKAIEPYAAKAHLVTIGPRARLEENVAVLSVAAH